MPDITKTLQKDQDLNMGPMNEGCKHLPTELFLNIIFII